MRGKREDAPGKPLAGRITPAHAGKTPMMMVELKVHRDHPRACGENAERPRAAASLLGSPPRMRGKL